MLKLENKARLQKLLKYRFKATAHFQQADLIYYKGDVTESLTSRGEENDFALQQVEAESTILSAYAKLRGSYDGMVIANSEDTNVNVQAAYVAHNLPDDLLIKNKNTSFKCIDLVSSIIANALIPFHVITRCDQTSGFYGCGKKSVFKKF